MKNQITFLDGAVGTCLWGMAERQNPVWQYNIEQPDIVLDLHRQYVDAGSAIIASNTFSATPSVVSAAGHNPEAVIRQGVALAKEAADKKARVALDIGPLTELIEPYGDLSEDEARDIYTLMIGSGMKEHPDLIFLETFMDIEMLCIAAEVAREHDVPLLCSMSFEKVGKTMMGNSVEQMIERVAEFSPEAVGLNCSLEPPGAIPVLRQFCEHTNLPLIFKPNAGNPRVDSEGKLLATPSQDFVDSMEGIPLNRQLYLGGCCGTSPACIRMLREKYDK